MKIYPTFRASVSKQPSCTRRVKVSENHSINAAVGKVHSIILSDLSQYCDFKFKISCRSFSSVSRPWPQKPA